ncbi:hypothetical protein M0802_012870 [Mischocyttarus mexicanus]|nr:hypothetical protein M0802_012870 [Mischocyttarus mexicanus]
MSAEEEEDEDEFARGGVVARVVPSRGIRNDRKRKGMIGITNFVIKILVAGLQEPLGQDLIFAKGAKKKKKKSEMGLGMRRVGESRGGGGSAEPQANGVVPPLGKMNITGCNSA